MAIDIVLLRSTIESLLNYSPFGHLIIIAQTKCATLQNLETTTMPKKIFHKLLLQIRNDISSQYKPGQRYLTVRQVAEKFGASLQTAQRAIKQLETEGYISAAPRSGIIIKSTNVVMPQKSRRIAVVSSQRDRRFDEAFLTGIRCQAEGMNVTIEFHECHRKDSSHVSFGEYLLSLNADGIIALAFLNSALGFYHAMREGLDVVTDIIPDDLPQVPAVQTDNFRYGFDAGKLLKKKKYQRALIVSYYPSSCNRRAEGFAKGFGGDSDAIDYVWLSRPDAIQRLDHYFYFLKPGMAIFSTDYAANYIVGAKFIQHGLNVTNDNFIVYDSEEAFFRYPGLKPVRAAAPALQELGKRLCEVLLHKWQTGLYPTPVQQRV